MEETLCLRCAAEKRKKYEEHWNDHVSFWETFFETILRNSHFSRLNILHRGWLNRTKPNHLRMTFIDANGERSDGRTFSSYSFILVTFYGFYGFIVFRERSKWCVACSRFESSFSIKRAEGEREKTFFWSANGIHDFSFSLGVSFIFLKKLKYLNKFVTFPIEQRAKRKEVYKRICCWWCQSDSCETKWKFGCSWASREMKGECKWDAREEDGNYYLYDGT